MKAKHPAGRDRSKIPAALRQAQGRLLRQAQGRLRGGGSIELLGSILVYSDPLPIGAWAKAKKACRRGKGRQAPSEEWDRGGEDQDGRGLMNWK